MDGDGDGSISVSELERALVRARTTPHLRDATVQAIVLNKLESALLRASNNGLKLVDVFAALDTSGDGLIDANELRDLRRDAARRCELSESVAQLAAPGGIASQVARRKREAAAKAKAAAEAKAARRALMQRRRRKEAAEASGAADVLRIINAAMVARGQRLQQIFVLLDTSGDGFLQMDELKRAFRAIGLKKRAGADFELDQKTFASFDTNGDGKVSLAEFNANLHPKTRKKIVEKLDGGWKFDEKLWAASQERHAKWNMAKVFLDFDVDGDGV